MLRGARLATLRHSRYESTFEDSNQFIHTTGDTMDKLSLDHMKEFSKVAVGFAVELSHPQEE